MAIDVLAIMASVPASLALSKSALYFHPFSFPGLATWLAIAAVGHVIFRLNGLYSTIWRLASTQDFMNISRACLMLTLGLYAVGAAFRTWGHLRGLNERQFIAFFLIMFIVVSAPRLAYRYLRDGDGWHFMSVRGAGGASKQAFFVGPLNEADIVIRLARGGGLGDVLVVGILSDEPFRARGIRVQQVPVLGSSGDLEALLEKNEHASQVGMVIFGRTATREPELFAELVRIARSRGIVATQFLGLSRYGGNDNALGAVELERMLERSAVRSDVDRLRTYCRGRRILVTGGAGSIGSALVRRILDLGADQVMVVDRSEFGIFQLRERMPGTLQARLSTRLLDIGDENQLSRAIAEFRPCVVFHAAALKHVPILEENWVSAIKTNVLGTMTCAELAARHGVPQFVLVSSDKAADPVSVLGLTKRMAEQIINALHFSERSTHRSAADGTSFIAVRFGNVVGSDGSVATIFQSQIDRGHPVTVTDPRMMRYFMTMGEAVDLVITSAADAARPDREDDFGIYMLDMGEPVSIVKLAETMIKLAGKQPYTEVPISITGVRPGEKLRERLRSDGERVTLTRDPNILGLTTGIFSPSEIAAAVRALEDAALCDDRTRALNIMKRMFRSAGDDFEADDRREAATGT